MVPWVVDDFILTISDHDDISDDGDNIDDIAPAKLSGHGKKRKYTGDEEDDAVSEEKKSKKAKKENKNSKKNDKSKKTSAKAQDGSEDEEQMNGADGGAFEGDDLDDMASDFDFQIGGVDSGVIEDFDGWEVDTKRPDAGSLAKERKSTAVDVDEIIDRRRKKKGIVDTEQAEEVPEEEFAGFAEDEDELLAEDGFGMGVGSDVEEESGDDEHDEEDEAENGSEGSQAEDESDTESVAVPVPHPMDLEASDAGEDSEVEDPKEAKRRAEFFAPDEDEQSTKKTLVKSTGSFQTMSLSRPILRGLASVGFTEPTPIQQKTIPMALQGKDVVGGAVTGSGKTAAFLIPILERLLHRPKKIATTRVAIFMPTRELAVQCFNVAKKLSSHTDITFAQLVGGFSVREQEAILKTRPDVVIATPGRFIDHMRNSAAFAVDTLEILVLDEADRMLEEGFADELNEILTTIPKSRQTMVFSATMTDSVDKLIRVGMNRPVRLLVDAKKQTVSGLVQEFVRLRPGKEDRRLAYLMYLCDKLYTDRVIIFFRQKKEAHRIRIIFGLCGLKAAELHGSMSQEQRIQSVESFRSGKASYLLATDLASRGLDIKNVNTVLNYEAPQSHEIYLHRVGRTARAGRTGRSCTIAAEPDRKVVKAAVKSARAQGAKVVSRQVPPEEVEHWAEKLSGLEDEVEEVLEEEKEERALSITERDLKRGENLIEHEDEIKSRPRRTWFESEKQKKQAKEKGSAELNGPAPKKEKKKLSGKDRKRLEIRDVRTEGKVWKKGKEERGKGIEKAKEKGKKGKSAMKSKGKKFGKGKR